MPRAIVALALLLAAAAAPTAFALDTFPSEAETGALHASFLLRDRAQGLVNVSSEPHVDAAVARPGAQTPPPEALRRTPFEASVPEDPVPWHGLDGTFQLVLQRDDPSQDVEILVEDGSGTGVMLVWPGVERETPGAPWYAIMVLASGLAAAQARSKTLSRRPESPDS